MKKSSLILLLWCFTISLKAQIDKTKGYLYANGGLNYSSLYERSSNAPETNGIFGPELGLSLRVKYKSYWGWGFEVGGYYSMKGVKFKDANTDADTKVTLDYGGL